jgi:agmatinase
MKNNFLGLSEEFSSFDNSKIVILPVPFDKTTTYIHGSEKGPKAIIEASKYLELYDIETDIEVYKKGIFTANENDFPSSQSMLTTTFNDILSFLKKDKFVVTLGGEHSISLAPIKAHATHFKKNISVLHFDAHSDQVPEYKGDIYSHASVIARVKELPTIENVVSVGIRSMAAEEKKYINFQNTYFAHALDKNNLWMKKACNSLLNDVYITFDLDVFDSSIMPSTGTPEPGGMFWNEITHFLHMVSIEKNIIGFDVVELCPIKNFIAPDFLAAKLIYKLLSYIFNKG